MQRATIVAAILAAAPMVYAVGRTSVINNCDHDVNLWTADTQRGQIGPTLLLANNKNVTPWDEPYHMVYDGSASHGGVSIKLTTADSCEGAITQYEYTYSSSGTPDLWYDISNVNCKESDCPFWSWGFYLDAPIPVSCAANIVCDAVYNLFNDDKATHGTTSDQDLTFYLCGKDGSSSGVDTETTPAATSSVATYSAPASSYVAPTSTYTPTPTPTPTPTTLVTATPSAALVQAENVVDEGNYIITEVVTEYATAVVTAYAKRSPEPQAHAHHKRAHNHHGHPHWRK